MNDDLYSHRLIKPLIEAGPDVPADDIVRLSKEIRKNKKLARNCNQLFKIETSFNGKPESYLAIWLAFSLAKALDEEAISSLFDMFDLVDPMEHDMLWEMAQFALWQYGDIAVREVLKDFLRIAEIDRTGYYLGVLDVVGLSGDQLLRRRVADKAIEALLSPKTAPAALMGLVDICLILKDKRLPSILSEWKKRLSEKERSILEEAEQALLDNDPELRNDEFHLAWTDLAGFSAEHFSIHFKGGATPPLFTEDIKELKDDFEKLAASFRNSSRFLELPEAIRENPEKVISILIDTFIILFESFGAIPEEADAEEIAELMIDYLPRKMVAGASEFELVPDLLESFYKFITDSYSKEEGNEFASFIQASAQEMLTNANDSSYWDSHKILAMNKRDDQ